MFFKRIKQDLDDLFRRVIALESRAQQHGCDHVYLLSKYAYSTMFGCEWLEYKCRKCRETKMRLWSDLSKQEQQAAKVLKVVPADWPVKTKGGK